MWNNIKSKHRHVTLSLYVCLLLLALSCSTKSPVDKWHKMYNKEWAQTQLDSILAPYLHMDWDTTSLKITFSDAVPPIIEEYGTCKEYGNTKLKVYSVWSLPFDNADDAYPMSFYVRYGDVTVLSKANDGSITVELDSAGFQNAVEVYKKEQRAIKEEERTARQERKNAVDLAYSNKTRVHFGMSSKDYYNCNKLFRTNFVNGLIGDGAFDSHFEPYFSNGIFVGFEISSSSKIKYDNVMNHALMTRIHTAPGIRFDSRETNYTSKLYNLQIYELYSSQSYNGTTIKVWWNRHMKIYE